MKFTQIFLLGLAALLFSCNSPQPNDVPEEETGPQQWVTYTGTQGPGLGKTLVLISGDEEYRSEEALPQLAKILAQHHGFTCKVLFSQDPAQPGIIAPNHHFNIPGLEALETADLMVIFTRFRALPDSQMQYIDAYLNAGKPVIGIRTATHAFRYEDSTHAFRHYGNYYQGAQRDWEGGFGRVVLGEKWISHHGHHKHQSTRGRIPAEAEGHPILSGIGDGEIWGPTDVYGVRLPLPGDTQPLVLGEVVNRSGEYDESDPFYGMKESDREVATSNPARESMGNPNTPMMPVAWIRTYQVPGATPGRAFAATIGSSTDMVNESVRRMYVNAVFHLLDLPVPEAATVELVGSYAPSAYAFKADSFWVAKQAQIADLAE